MSNFTLNTKIILRNDTKANWASANPVLTKGEMGIEVDTGKIKIGDGVKTWTELGYANVLPSDLDNLGAGDMLKEIYDTNNNGKVDNAELADRATLADNANMAEEAKVAGKLKTPVNIAGVAFDGSADIALTKANVGLGNVDNTSDLAKPISTATQGALDAIKGNAGEGVTLGTVDAKASKNATDITALKGKVTTAEGKITALEGLTTTQGEKIVEIEGKADANATTITGVQGKVTALETKTGAIETDVTALKELTEEQGTKITAVESKATANETAIAGLDTKVKANETAIGTLETTTASHTEKITAVEGKVKASEGEIATLKGKMTTVEGKVSTAETKISALETKVDVAKVSTAIADAITASEAKLGTSATKNVGTAVGNVVEVQADGKIASSIIPSIAITDTFVVASEEAMLALSKAEKGDVAIRTDVKKSYILAENGYDVLENWKLLETPTDAVTSVNGQTGAVTLTSSNIAEGSNLYYTEARVNANFRKQNSTSLADSATLLRSTDTLILNGGNA